MPDTSRDIYRGSTVTHNFHSSPPTNNPKNYGTFPDAEMRHNSPSGNMRSRMINKHHVSPQVVIDPPVGYHPHTSRWYPQAQSPATNCCQDLMNFNISGNAFSSNPAHAYQNPAFNPNSNYCTPNIRPSKFHPLYGNHGNYGIPYNEMVMAWSGRNGGGEVYDAPMMTQYNTPYQYYIQQFIIQSNDTIQGLVIPNPLNVSHFKDEGDSVISSPASTSLEMSHVRSQLALSGCSESLKVPTNMSSVKRDYAKTRSPKLLLVIFEIQGEIAGLLRRNLLEI